MSNPYRFWTDERLDLAERILRTSRTHHEACDRISKEMGVPMDIRILDNGFRRAKPMRPRPRSILGTLLADAPATTTSMRVRETASPKYFAPTAPPKQPPVTIFDDTVEDDTYPDIPIVFDDAPTSGPVTSAPSMPAPPPPPSTASDLHQHRMQNRVSDLEAAKKRYLKEIADLQAQLEAMREIAAARPLPPIAPLSKVGGHQRQGVPVMLCSDWHVEEPVDPKTVNGLNCYNLEIAERCIDSMADAYEWLLMDSRYDCRTGVIWLGGDLISGFIHEELMEQNFLSPTQAVLWLQERIERMLRKIAANCQTLERIIVVCNDGNHGRLTHKTRVATRTANSIEWLMYHNIARRMADDPRFVFHVADGEYAYLDVYNQALCFFHGDSVRYMGGVGGLLIPMKRGINELRKYRKVDIVNFGHFHQRIDLPDMVGNGSMIGINAYAMRIKASPEPRQQSWYLVDSERGKCLSAPIWLPQS